MFKRGLIAVGIAIAVIIGMLWYGGEQLQSIVWGPPLPRWPMFVLWAVGSVASLAAMYYFECARVKQPSQ